MNGSKNRGSRWISGPLIFGLIAVGVILGVEGKCASAAVKVEPAIRDYRWTPDPTPPQVEGLQRPLAARARKSPPSRFTSVASLSTVQENGRPVAGSGPIGMNYQDVEAFFLDAGPSSRIWYVEEGPHAVPPAEGSDGHPLYVEQLARVTEEILAGFAALGWHTPLSDLGRGLEDDGGDARFDVYLLDFGGGSDGLFSREFCIESPERCGGYIALENDFEGYSYGSHDEAFRTLVSHELAHAVGAAYLSGTAGWWDEGFAVWAELALGEVEEDVFRLMRRWFASPSRPLNDRVQPGEAWPYAASAFIVFLADRFGAGVLEDAWARLEAEQSLSPVAALDAALGDLDTDLDFAWGAFMHAAWFSGERADVLGEAGTLRFAPRFPTLEAVGSLGSPQPEELHVSKWSFQAFEPAQTVGYYQVESCGDGVPLPIFLEARATGAVDVVEAISGPRPIDRSSVWLVGGRTRAGDEQCVLLRTSDDPETLCPRCGEEEESDAGTCDAGTAECGDEEKSPAPRDQGCAASSRFGGRVGIVVGTFGLCLLISRRRPVRGRFLMQAKRPQT